MGMSSYYKASTHKYCSKCGSETVKGREYVTRYTPEDGTKIYRHVLKCPKWSFPFRMSHFREEFEGEDMIVNYDYY